jgi:hypothetical protein
MVFSAISTLFVSVFASAIWPAPALSSHVVPLPLKVLSSISMLEEFIPIPPPPLELMVFSTMNWQKFGDQYWFVHWPVGV